MPVIAVDLDRQLRILRHEFVQHGRQAVRGKRDGNRDPECADGIGRALRDDLFRVLQIGHQAQGAFVQFGAAFGQGQGAAGAVDQAHAEPVFQVGQAPADRGLDQPQFAPPR
ncbi:hypothetical protein LP420_04640 [Massilia sp. B-10]|nr:hypothetical protein LP420_04640 [Massilia sp. B-10]